MPVNIQTSLHGRRLGLTATGGIIANEVGSTAPSIAIMGTTDRIVNTFKTAVETVSSSAATMINYGLTVISSDVANASVLILSAPVAGVEKQIYGDSSASSITLNTTAASITFGASVLSSAFVFDNAGGVRGTSLVLKGISATRWALLGRKVTA